MSIIAALAMGGKSYVGANTGYTLANDSTMDAGSPPWVFFQDWAIGFTGSMLALNVCRSEIKNTKSSIESAGDLVIELGKILTEYDIGAKNSGDVTWSFGIWCIIAHNSGKIWDLDESLCLGPIPEGKFWSRGSGEKYALGAAYAVTACDKNMAPEIIMKLSIESAIRNDLYCPGRAFVKSM